MAFRETGMHFKVVDVSVQRPRQLVDELRHAEGGFGQSGSLGNNGAARAGAPGVTFQETGAITGSDAAELGPGLSFAIAQNTVPGHLAAFVKYDAIVAAHLTNNAFAAGLKLSW